MRGVPVRGPRPAAGLPAYDFTKTQLIQPGVAYCVAGKVNSTDKLYLVLESVRLDTKHTQYYNVPDPAGGAGGLLLP